MTTPLKTIDHVAEQRDAFMERLLQSISGAFDVFALYLGDRLGYYQAMAGGEWLTSTVLAERTGTHERYVREWLEQQTVTGILEVEDAAAGPKERRFRLPAAHVEVLADPESLNFMAPLAQLVAGAVSPLESILNAYRTGGGVPFHEYGVDVREGQARVNRTAFLQQIGAEWLPAMPDVHARLQAEPPARVADIGCGAGWSCIGIAQAYPKVRVDGYDLDRASAELACANVRDAGLADRVAIEVRDAGDPVLAGRYDLVTAFECVHDMSDPVSALRSMRRLAGERGTVLIVDERVGDSFTPTGNDVEGMMYGWSVLHCLPVGMADHPSAATGTVMRTDTLRQYAKEAGLRDVEVLPIENFFFRFYRLMR
jgi:SAM-dependent methyltransferase